MFHNPRGYDRHFISQDISNFDENINAIPNDKKKNWCL